jgi:hypothetical protein
MTGPRSPLWEVSGMLDTRVTVELNALSGIPTAGGGEAGTGESDGKWMCAMTFDVMFMRSSEPQFHSAVGNSV